MSNRVASSRRASRRGHRQARCGALRGAATMMRIPGSWLHALAAQTYVPPFQQHLPSNVDSFLRTASTAKMALHRLKRGAWLSLNRQTGLERSRIGPDDRRILWIYLGMPQVGDSMMDLACRVLLRDRPVAIDLLTVPHLAQMYSADDVFRHVFSDPAEAARNDYDLAVVLSASSQTLRVKLRLFRRLPFVNLYRFHRGTELHRTLFGFFRLDQLLGNGWPTERIEAIAKPHMVAGDVARQAVDALSLPERFVALAVGGVHDWRTYRRWPEVLPLLAAAEPDMPVVLLGSSNGAAMREQLLALPRRPCLVDRVDRHSLQEVHEVFRRCTVAACADGGLLHLANAADVPTVSLFAERIDPTYRLTPANRSIAFYAPTEVSDIEPKAVADAIVAGWRGGIQAVTITRLPGPVSS
jgi:heptosyltransferase-2